VSALAIQAAEPTTIEIAALTRDPDDLVALLRATNPAE
jgi:hypothetical protein